MINTSVKSGSFRVNVPISKNEDYCVFPKYSEIKEYQQRVVPMITMNELADGWVQMVPIAKNYIKTFQDENKLNTRKVSNIYRLKVNLAQLPPYLWHRMKYYYDNGEPTNKFTVRNGMFYYLVEPTNVDDEIRELAGILNHAYDVDYKQRVNELLTVLKDNDVYGWVVIKAKNMYRISQNI
jgi:hypothetical protein